MILNINHLLYKELKMIKTEVDSYVAEFYCENCGSYFAVVQSVDQGKIDMSDFLEGGDVPFCFRCGDAMTKGNPNDLD